MRFANVAPAVTSANSTWRCGRAPPSDGLAPRIRNLAEWARHILAHLGHLGQLRAELTLKAFLPADPATAEALSAAARPMAAADQIPRRAAETGNSP